MFLFCEARLCCAAESIVLFNGNVYTAADQTPHAEGVVAVSGHIVYVGTNAEALRRGTSRRTPHGFARLTILPGLTDSHAHLADIGFRELSFNLEGTVSLRDLKKPSSRAREAGEARRLADRTWMDRVPLDAPATFPTRVDLG